jgi:CRP/FNR family transcriptional regulator
MVKHLCADCRVRDKALCNSLSDAELLQLNAISRHIALEKAATLMWAGEEAAVCGNVLSGILKMTAITADGSEQIVGLLYPGDFVGRPQPGEAPFSIAAVTDSQLCIFPRALFQSMLGDHVAMERLLLERTMAALDEARSRMLMLARGSAEEKLASFLVEMADRSVAAGGTDSSGAGGTDAAVVTLDLPLSRGQIANVLGLTIETVSRQMTQFRASGLIDLPGGRRVTILDRRGLMQRGTTLRASTTHSGAWL